MKKTVIFSAILCIASSIHASSVRVNNNTGEQNVYGAIYYVFNDSAQRAGDVQQFRGLNTLNMPEEEKPNAARYLIISRGQGLLEPMITEPFGTVGIRLISLNAGGQSAGTTTSIVLERSLLPSESV